MAEVTIQQAFDLVLRHRQAGRATEAETLYRHILGQIPKDPNALNTLGTLALQAGQNEFAADLFGQATDLQPGEAEFHDHLGMALLGMDRWDDAAASLARAMELEPGPETCLNLAHALRRLGRFDEAIARYHQAIALQPSFHSAHNNLGNLLRERGRLEEAIASYRRAIELKADYLEAINNLGSALLETGKPREAIEQYQHALALRSDLPELHNNLGKALRADGEVADAIAAHERALALKSDDADAHWNRGLMLQLSGQFEQGWDEYEWRWLVPEFRSPRRNFRQPLWTGQPLKGRRILLHAEQGFGDTIQFVRYVPRVAQAGGRVILECPPELCRLMQTVPGIDQLIANGAPLPEFDWHCPLLSLPRAFRTRLQTIRGPLSYLPPDPAAIDRWKSRLQLPTDRLRVGLIWAGSAANPNDRNRSIALGALAPLADCGHVAFYNLQTGPAAGQANEQIRFRFMNTAPEFVDFADAAAFMANLDLIITVDTAAAHLAGAIGTPAWVLVPFAPDWRWLLGRHDSPWYPTMRLFRQPGIGDWQAVVGHVAGDLQQVAARVTSHQWHGRPARA